LAFLPNGVAEFAERSLFQFAIVKISTQLVVLFTSLSGLKCISKPSFEPHLHLVLAAFE
jgi:hypothetical protein